MSFLPIPPDVIELFQPKGGHPYAPVSFKPSPSRSCCPPVSPHFVWPTSYYGTRTCCHGEAQEGYWSMQIHNQYYSRGTLTTVCDLWFRTHLPLIYVLTTMDYDYRDSLHTLRLGYIPSSLDPEDLMSRGRCHSCSNNEALFTFSYRKNLPDSLWVSQIKGAYKLCLRCIHAHYLFDPLFPELTSSILRKLYPRVKNPPVRERVDTSRYYMENGYGPVPILDHELDLHRGSTQDPALYYLKVYGFKNPLEIFGDS